MTMKMPFVKPGAVLMRPQQSKSKSKSKAGPLLDIAKYDRVKGTTD